MHARTLVCTALIAASATLAACSSDNVLGLGVVGNSGDTSTVSNARIRVVNATATSLDIATAGVVTAGNGGVGFGSSSSCISTSATTPNLAVRIAGTTSVVPGLATAFQSGVSYTVIAYPGSSGTTQFVTLVDTYAPLSGQVGFRVFNASTVGSSYDVYVTAPGTSLTGTPPTFGAVSVADIPTFIGVSTSASQQVRITTAGSKTVLLDVGNVAFVAGQNITMIIAPPLVGTTIPRAFMVASC